MTKQPHTFRNAHQRRSAFTLFEMLLVLALLLVLVSVVWPAVMRISSSNRLRQSMQDVNSVFAAARIRAIEHGVNYHVYLELGGNQYLIVPAMLLLSTSYLKNFSSAKWYRLPSPNR